MQRRSALLAVESVFNPNGGTYAMKKMRHIFSINLPKQILSQKIIEIILYFQDVKKSLKTKMFNSNL